MISRDPSPSIHLYRTAISMRPLGHAGGLGLKRTPNCVRQSWGRPSRPRVGGSPPSPAVPRQVHEASGMTELSDRQCCILLGFIGGGVVTGF